MKNSEVKWGKAKDQKNKKYVIEIDGRYQFKPQFDYEVLPGGIYVPVIINGNFMLEKTFEKGTIADEISNSVELDELSLRHSFLTTEKSREALKQAKEIVSTNHSVSDYFHLEKYNKGLKWAKQRIENFLISNKPKISILLHGPTGTGKTRFISHMSSNLVDNHDAIGIKVESIEHVTALRHSGQRPFFRYLQDRLKVIVIEELYELIATTPDKTKFLNLLDSPIFRQNYIFLITTNFPEKLPINIIDRPKRIDDPIEVDIDGNDPEYVYEFYKFLIGKEFPDNEKEADWLKKARKELTPAYFEELFTLAENEGFSLQKAWEYLKKRRDKIKNNWNDTEVGFSAINHNDPF